MTNASVILWGSPIGAVSWDEPSNAAVFQYDPAFLRSHVELSPLMMPLRAMPYTFPALSRETFKGLPGLLSDSLPDKFGNAVIDAWLAAQGRSAESFNSVERLCYVGKRGMGALEYEPSLQDRHSPDDAVEVDALVDLSNRILSERGRLSGAFNGVGDQKAVEDILRVGTSAGGARAKAILAWNPQTQEFRSGQVDLPSGFEPWIMKFDGVSANRDKELADPLGFGKIEYAYSQLAAEAGIAMMECRLFQEGGRSHFMTRRFDRDADGRKIHMQSLGALTHADFNVSGLYSYEQTLQMMKALQLPQVDLDQQVLRTMFNVAGCNHDDHVKNIAFLMDRGGNWRLSPAFDVTYAYNPDGLWTNQHQMRVNGKQSGITRADLIALAAVADIKRQRAEAMVDDVIGVIGRWPEMAERAGVTEKQMEKIRNALVPVLQGLSPV